MTKYILKRVGYSIVTLFLLVAITFFMMQLLPGDPFTGEKQLPAAQMEALYAKYGLDKPVWQQFFIYIGNVVQGDLGVSLTYNRAVTLMITEAFAVSFDVGIRSICFAFIGGEKTLAVSMNGKTSKPGKITSPTLTGGIKTLTFKYGTAYSTKSSKFSFTVKVLQNGSVVKETTMTPDMEIKTAYDFSWDVNVSGDFSIEIVNNCPSGKDSNVDRVAIWNLTWS